MSRVDEALRRAEGRTKASQTADLAPTEIRADDRAPDDGPLPLDLPSPAIPLPASAQPPLFATLTLDALGSGLGSKIVVDQHMKPVSREQYRRLAATLHQTQSVTGLKVVLVVSAAMSEGKTLTSANLALTFSESYQRRVLLIDGDLRRPSLDALFRIEASPGLNEGLTSVPERMVPLRQVTPRLMVLPAGQPMADPMGGLTSERMRRLIGEARASFDWVIIDTPPVGILPDANLLASIADGAVLVVRAESTPYDLVQRAIAALGRDRILGVVLNRASAADDRNYYAGYYATRSYGVTPV